MANLHKYTVQESLNASTGNAGKWTVNELGSGGDTGIRGTDDSSNNILLAADTTIVIMQGTVEFNFSFRDDDPAITGSEDLSTSYDLSVPADTIFSINVPRGLGENVYLLWQSTTATEGTIKVIEV